MKCPTCGKADLVGRRVPFTYGGLYLGDFDAEVCPNCGEILFTESASEDINQRAMELGVWGKEIRALSWPAADFPVEADLIEYPSLGFFGRPESTTVRASEPRMVVKMRPGSTSSESPKVKALGILRQAQTA